MNTEIKNKESQENLTQYTLWQKYILEKVLSLKKQNLKSHILNIDARSGFFFKAPKMVYYAVISSETED